MKRTSRIALHNKWMVHKSHTNMNPSKHHVIEYAKRKLAKEGVPASKLALLDCDYTIRCECCKNVAMFTYPNLCFGCIDKKRRQCPEGSTNVFLIKGSYICFDHTSIKGSKCFRPNLKRSDVLFVLRHKVIKKMIELSCMKLDRDVVNTIAVILTRLFSIDKVL